MAYNMTTVLPAPEFNAIALELLDHCNSHAYVFVNQPGLRLEDFDYEDAWTVLPNYLSRSSSALRFEQVEVSPSNVFENLIAHTKRRCDVQREIILRAEQTNQFEPYIDAQSRIIQVHFSPLPGDGRNERPSREDVLADHDQRLRRILGRLPSPAVTVIYTSLEPADRLSASPPRAGIFPEIFEHESRRIEYERNDRDLQVNRYFPSHHPKMEPIEEVELSLLDPKFIQSNLKLLKLIAVSAIGSLTWQLYSLFSPKLPVATPKGTAKRQKGQKKLVKLATAQAAKQAEEVKLEVSQQEKED